MDKAERRKKEFLSNLRAEAAFEKRKLRFALARKSWRNSSLNKKRDLAAAKEKDTKQRAELERAVLLDTLKRKLNSDDEQTVLESIITIRRMLSIEFNPPIQEFIDAGMIPRIIALLKYPNPKIQFESCWALTNVASGGSDQTTVVIEQGAVPILRDLLSSPSDDVREQAVWGLGNIAGDSPRLRDFVLLHMTMDPILNILGSAAKVSMLRNATWTLSNLCRGKPQPAWEFVKSALPVLKDLISNTKDEEVLTDACWAISYLSDGPNERVQDVIDSGCVPRILELLTHPNFSVQTPALRTVGNIVTGNDSQTQVILDGGALPILGTLLSSPKKGIRKEAVWTISNVTAGSKAQIQAVIDAQLIPKIIEMCKNGDFDLKKESAWALSNATSGGTWEQISYMIKCGFLEPICNILETSDVRLSLVAMEAIENVFRGALGLREEGGNTMDLLKKFLDDYQAVPKLKTIAMTSGNADAAEKARTIVEDLLSISLYEELGVVAGANNNNDAPPIPPPPPSASGFSFQM